LGDFGHMQASLALATSVLNEDGILAPLESQCSPRGVF
jgi:hypothetical protein